MKDEVTNFLWNVHGYHCNFITHADTKAAVVFAWSTGILTWHCQHAKIGSLFTIASRELSWFHSLMMLLGFVLPVLSGFVSALVISPMRNIEYPTRMKKETDGNELIYWGSIRLRTKEEYIAETGASSRLERATASHIHNLAEIANRKYLNFAIAFWLAVGGTSFVFVNYAIRVNA
jgi:hypothetical protein